MPWKVIEYQNIAGDQIVARVPEQGTFEVVSGSQLIVQDGQFATFFHDGKPADSFKAGRYALKTQNLPVLSKFLRVTTLSRTPFRSYAYYVALKTFNDLGWGTPQPILYRDDVFKMVNLRAHGTFAVRISSPRVFMQSMVGTQAVETTYAVEEYFRKIIVSRLAQILPKVLTSIVDLAQHYEKIAAYTKKAVYKDFDQYGLELVDLIIESISMPEDVQEAINRAAGMRAVGEDEVNKYERVARADALRDAAKQPGSGANGLTAGLGIGAGLGMAKEMMDQVTAKPNPASPPSVQQ